jgi:type IV secretory pathway VirJ component
VIRRLACGLLAGAALAGGVARAETVAVPGFGAVTLVHRTPRPRHVVVLLAEGAARDHAGTAGTAGTAAMEMARVLAGADALVIAVDAGGYLRRLAAARDGCAYPAGNLEELAELVEKRLDYARYATPFLAGAGGGAALAYAGLAQSPVGTFEGLITLGFHPALPTDRELCPGRGLAVAPASAGTPPRLLPAARLQQPWVALQGEADADFPLAAAAAFVRQVPGARLVAVPRLGALGGPQGGTGTGPAARTRDGTASGSATVTPGETRAGSPGGAAASVWEAPLRAAFAGLKAAAVRSDREEAAAQRSLAKAVDDLPLLELPAQGAPTGTLAVVVSGDGGWNGIDRKVARVLSERGVAVAGLNSKRYFWTARAPAGAAADLARILRHYLAAWGCKRAILVGYSLGADALPFMTGRLPPELLDRVRLIALMSPGPTTRLEVFTRLKPSPAGADLPVLPELRKLAGRPILCLYGDRESQSLCPLLGTLAKAVKLPGSHAFGGDFDGLVDHILAAARGGA